MWLNVQVILFCGYAKINQMNAKVLLGYNSFLDFFLLQFLIVLS